MVELKFEKSLNYNAYLLKSKGTNIELILEFYGIEKPQKGDLLFIHEDLLNPKSEYFVQPYAFELTKINLKEIKEMNDRAFALVKQGKKIYSLKRIYG